MANYQLVKSPGNRLQLLRERSTVEDQKVVILFQ